MYRLINRRPQVVAAIHLPFKIFARYKFNRQSSVWHAVEKEKGKQ